MKGKAIRYAEGPRRGKQVALTFDDGPQRNTAELLEVLLRKKVRATFFPIGKKQIEDHEWVLRLAVRRGHALGNHTLNHEDVSAADEDASDEIHRATAAIEAATGFTPCLFRAPAGKESKELYDLVRSKGMTTIYSSVDPSDWEVDAEARDIEEHVLDNVESGSIVLLHDDYASDSTLEALPRIIDGLRERGYRLVTVPELLDIPLTYGSRGAK